MNTPIVDFVNKYKDSHAVRAHMPGHKGAAFLGAEALDITEIKGADSLYYANSIIAKSESNAAGLFGTRASIYSTEGSSQCIKAMLYLVTTCKKNIGKHIKEVEHPYIIAGRNAHTAFIHALALLGLNVSWIYPDDNNICSCNISPETVKMMLQNAAFLPEAVYVTSPDYLGNNLDIKGIADVCHSFNVPLIVDNAHGAYYHFLTGTYKKYIHPMDAGADMCCDSAHKTLPVLTGGAYLHIRENEEYVNAAKYAMGIFGSTSPSYLILESLDLCNKYLEKNYETRLELFCDKVKRLKNIIAGYGFTLLESDPLKITVCINGIKLASLLREKDIECEYADCGFVVLMLTPENSDEDLNKIEEAFAYAHQNMTLSDIYVKEEGYEYKIPTVKLSIREAVMSRHENVSVSSARGRICASPTVSCPPAIAIAVPGEVIDDNLIKLFEEYGINSIEVI